MGAFTSGGASSLPRPARVYLFFNPSFVAAKFARLSVSSAVPRRALLVGLKVAPQGPNETRLLERNKASVLQRRLPAGAHGLGNCAPGLLSRDEIPSLVPSRIGSRTSIETPRNPRWLADLCSPGLRYLSAGYS